MTRGVSISNLGPTHPQHPSSRGAFTLTKVVGSTGPVLPSWRLQKVAGGLIQFEGLRLPGAVGGLPFRTPTGAPVAYSSKVGSFQGSVYRQLLQISIWLALRDPRSNPSPGLFLTCCT